METLSDGWREEIQEAIDNLPIRMSGSAYNEGYIAGIKKAIEIIKNHL
jgi:hypothetical protein